MFPLERTPALTILLLLIGGTTSAQGPVGPKSIDFGCPSKPPRLDAHGDPLPDGAIARLGTLRLRHAHLISGVAFSGDGKTIYASDFYSGVHVWNVADEKKLRRHYEKEHYCHALAISPNGKVLAVALGNLTVRLVDADTGEEIGALPKQDGTLNFLVFSPDGSRLAMGSGHSSVRLYDVAARRLVRTVRFPDQVGDAAFSSDGKLLAAGNKTGASLWDLEQDREVRRLENDKDGKESLRVAFAPNGGPMAVWGYDDGSVRLFDATGVKELRRLNREGAAVQPGRGGWAYNVLAKFSPGGKVLAIARDVGRIELWDADGGKKRHTLVFDSSQRSSRLAFSPDSTRLASAGSDMWGGDNTVRLWDVNTGKEVQSRTGHGAPITGVVVSPDGSTVATAGRDGIVHLWESRTGKHRARLEGGHSRFHYVSFSPDGQRVIAWGGYRGDGILRVWDARTGRLITRMELPHPNGFWETVSDDGKIAVSVDLTDKAVRFHDLATGEITRKVADDYYQRSVALSPTADRYVRLDGVVMTVADRKELVDFGSMGYRTWARFSADGQRVVALVMSEAMRNTYLSEPPADEIAVVDLNGKAPRRFGKRETYFPYETAGLSRDGRTVATVGGRGHKPEDQVLTLWEVETGRERASLRGHVGAMSSVAFSPDGRLIVTGSEDTTALVWDATRRPPAGSLATRFAELAGDDAVRAYASLWSFVDAPKTAVSFLQEQGVLFEKTDPEKIQGWIRELDSDRFAVRERASRQLTLVLDEAEWHLRKALEAKPSAESRRRIEDLLQTRATGLTGRELQRVRVIEILEHIAFPGGDAAGPAVDLLKKLAGGPPGARPTRDAQASLDRLGRRADGNR